MKSPSPPRAGADDLRTFEADASGSCVFDEGQLSLRKHSSRWRRKLTDRFGDGHELARNSNGLLGRYFYSADDYTKAQRPWLESAFRGYRMQAESAAQAIRQDEEAKEILAVLIDIYIKQGLS